MKNKCEIGELVLAKNSKGEYFSTGITKDPVVFSVYQIICTKDAPTQYVLDFINSENINRTRIFTENEVDPAPSNHPIFTIFGTRPSSASPDRSNGD
jgi:hypothetical protein